MSQRCGDIAETSYSRFAARIGPRVSRERLPLDGSLELTFRCNLRCAHCYVSQPAGDPSVQRQELTTTEILRLTDEVVDRGCLWMLLTGGEPLLRPDFPEIFLYMKRRGLLVTVFTNGTILGDRIADLFAEWPPLVVEVSIYGSTAAVYERVTRVPGSFRDCLAAIQRLAERRIRFRLKTILSKLNVGDVPAMHELAKAYGVEFHWDALVNCRVDGSHAPAAVRLDPAAILALELGDPKRTANFSEELARRQPLVSPNRLYTCGAFLHAFHVDPYGHLLPCMLVRRPVLNLREGSFGQAWDEGFPAARQTRRTREVVCDACAIRAVCDTCVGWAALETGNREARVPFLCELAHLRAAAFGKAEAPNLAR